MAVARALYPLTEAQEGLWYAQRLDPDNPIYNTGQYLDIRGHLDPARFADAVATALQEAGAIGVRMLEEESGPVQCLQAHPPARLELVDLRGAPDAEARALSRIRIDMETPLDPASDLLVREVLFTVSDDRFLWYQRVHHLVIDGYGTALLTNRILDLYAAANGAPVRGKPFGSYEAVLAEDREYRESSKREADRHYWMTEFAEAPVVTGLRPGDAVTSRTFLRETATLPTSLGEGLLRLADAAKAPWPDVLTVLTAAYLHRHLGGAEVVVGVPSMERLGTAAARVPAMVMNVLPFRCCPGEDEPLPQVIRDGAQRLRDMRRHGRYRSEQLRRDVGRLGADRRIYGALINVLPFEQRMAVPGATVAMRTLGTGPVDDITITVRGTIAAPLTLELDANPALYAGSDLVDHAARLTAFLTGAVEATRLADVPLVTDSEYRRWVFDVNDTARDVPHTTLPALIEAQIARTPDAEALVWEHGTLDYSALGARTAALAQAMIDSGVRPGDVVAVVLPRSENLVLTLVAVLRAGAAYLPIDPTHPQERVDRMLRSASPTLVVTEDWLGRIDSAQSVALERVREPAPGDAAYVIYTSGSTGEPKGAVIEHQSIVNRLEWMRTEYGIGAGDRILQKTPATFDVSVWEFFLAFLSGATLVVAPAEAHKDPAWLVSLIRDYRITTMHFVPSMLAAFLAEPSAAGLAIRRVFCSGEALTPQLRDRCHEVLRCELHNLYGPTEAAVDVTYWDASAGDRSSPVPIGRPVWNTQMYVLDARLRALPAGVTGDLYIGGVQLAREYLGRPDLTHERFVPSPFIDGARLYKTGDLAQWRSDGVIVFLGRSDHQVKIRGLRIELGEIEAALASAAGMAHVAVIVRDDAGEPQIVAYVVAQTPESRLDAAELRAHARTLLPDYMVPAHVVFLDALPLTRSGKLDRAALPAPTRLGSIRGRALETDTERRVATLFAEVLAGVMSVPDAGLSADDDFFALGGHSLLAARLMARVRDAWSCQFRLGVLFANPTIARFALAIDTEMAVAETLGSAVQQGLEPVIHLVRTERPAPALFCIHPAGGISWCYGRLARAVAPLRNVYGLQADALAADRPMPVGLDEMAALYAERVMGLQPSGPYHLLGWSVGGIIAHAIAVHLQQRGAVVGVVALLDAYPSDRWRNQPEPEDGAALRALLLIAGHDPSAVKGRTLTRDAVIDLLRAERHPLGDLSNAELDGVLRVVDGNNRLVRRFAHDVLRAPVLYFRAALDHQDDGLDPSQWAPYVTGGMQVHDVPAVHASLTGETAVAQIAPVLSAALAAEEDRG